LPALLNWHRRHRFCPACAGALLVTDAGFSRNLNGLWRPSIFLAPIRP
jgi:NADH pyrophosphatase NudC (nudix superfamily)